MSRMRVGMRVGMRVRMRITMRFIRFYKADCRL